ncbi:MAG: hypothetical protein ACKVLL_17485 [Verrucomicrobiales bacterium]|jgi:hypothetical protein
MNFLLPTAFTLACAIPEFSAELPRSEPEANDVSSVQYGLLRAKYFA